MKYDFNEVLPLKGSGSIKWDQWGDREILGLANADMDFRVADIIERRLISTAKRRVFDYRYKPEEHYNAIIEWYRRKYNWNVKKEWILTTPGIWVATHICFEAYTKPGDRIIVQTPHFHPIQVIADRMGRHIVTNPMVLNEGRYELDFEDFEQKIIDTNPTVYFMVNLQNPTGRLFTKEEIGKLEEICIRHHVLVVSDEVHANIRFRKQKHFPAPSVSKEAMENTIILNSASKAYNIMDLTYCFMVIPSKELRKKMSETLEGYSLDFATNAFSVEATTAALSTEADQWLAEVTTYLEENLEFLMEYFEKNIPLIKPIRPEGSFLIWLDCRALNLSTEELANFFERRAKVGLTAGAGYGECGVGFVRLNFGCPISILQEALKRIEIALSTL